MTASHMSIAMVITHSSPSLRRRRRSLAETGWAPRERVSALFIMINHSLRANLRGGARRLRSFARRRAAGLGFTV